MAKYTRIFTDIEDVDREILLRIPDDNNLLKACSLSNYTKKLCNNYFWKQRFIRKYVVDLDYDVGTKSQINYLKLYKELMNQSEYDILVFASEKGYLGLVKEMIRKGANIHERNNYAIRLAALNGHLEVLKYLIKKGGNIHAGGDYAFRFAAENGHLEIVKYLIEKGADIHAGEDSPLIWASENGHLEVVKYLIEKGANIHASHDWALRLAAYNEHLRVVGYLIEKGADIKSIRNSQIFD